MASLLRSVLRANVAASQWLNRQMPPEIVRDGNRDFLDHFLPRFLVRDSKIYDVGGGKQPYLSPQRKQELNATVFGLDISAKELEAAQDGAYDKRIVADVCHYTGASDADLVICQSLFEHVADTQSAIRGMASCLTHGGMLVAFIPCRNAPFARLNLVLPETLKRRLLFALYPEARHAQGFVAYYDRCVPNAVRTMLENEGFEIIELKPYWQSAYFSFLFPLHALWRFWTLLIFKLRATEYCETFSLAARKR